VRRADKNPKETGNESNPGRQQRAECPGEERRQEAGFVPPAHETDKLEHHDQRPRSCLGESETVHHLTGLEPAKCIDRLLRDVGQHGIGAAEGHDCGFAKEKAFLEQSVVPTEAKAGEKNRRPPKRQANDQYPRGARPGRTRTAG